MERFFCPFFSFDELRYVSDGQNYFTKVQLCLKYTIRSVKKGNNAVVGPVYVIFMDYSSTIIHFISNS